jgi:hypothetical protein
MIGRKDCRTEGEEKQKAKDHGLDLGLFNTMLARC